MCGVWGPWTERVCEGAEEVLLRWCVCRWNKQVANGRGTERCRANRCGVNTFPCSTFINFIEACIFIFVHIIFFYFIARPPLMFTAGPPVSKVSLQWSIYLLVGGQNCAMCFVPVRHFLSFPVTSCRSLSPATVAPPYRYNIGLNRWNSCFINSILIFYTFFFFFTSTKCEMFTHLFPQQSRMSSPANRTWRWRFWCHFALVRDGCSNLVQSVVIFFFPFL